MAPKSMVFEPDSEVKFSIEGDCVNGSWFAGTIVSLVDSDRVLVCYNSGQKEFVRLYQLRPDPPPESHWEFKSGDKVEVYHTNRWWAAHMTNNKDIISDLPDNVLLHIMNFMTTKDAVQTCVLSKRWKYLCKQLTSLTYLHNCIRKNISCDAKHFKKFASWVLFSRDNSYSLHNLTMKHCVDPELLDKLIKYAIFCNVKDLRMNVFATYRYSFEFLPSIFCCQSLTCLELSIGWQDSIITAPKSLHLPMVKRLHLERVQFTAGENATIEPFSNCHMLNTMILKHYRLHNDAKVLYISNTTLSSLTIFGGQDSKVVLSTPNVCSFSITGTVGCQLLSTCYLSILREVDVEIYKDRNTDWYQHISTVIEWLQVLYNAKILTFGTHATLPMLFGILHLLSVGPQPPSFVRLESVKVKTLLFPQGSDLGLNKLMEYLLQNSPMDKVDITTIIGILHLLSMGPQPPSFVRLESVRVNTPLCPQAPDRGLNILMEYLLQNSPMDKVDITTIQF